jgi:hypothetical protein
LVSTSLSLAIVLLSLHLIVLTDDLRLIAELLIGRYQDPQKQESCARKTTNLRDSVEQVEVCSLVGLDLLANSDEYVLQGVELSSHRLVYSSRLVFREADERLILVADG